jgi:protein-tyrosine-phosphatase
MGEALLKMLAGKHVEICSAGIKPGKEVNKQAVKAMKAIGYNLSGHQPKHVSFFGRQI